MRFCIETENLAIDTEEVSMHFFELCKQKAEQDYQEWSSNQIWESPEGDVLVIAVIESGHEITDLADQLKLVWSVDVDVLEKIEQLDDVFRHDSRVSLIKIYPAIANEPYCVAKKKNSFGTTERAAYYEKLHENADRRNDNAERRKIADLENLEDIPHIPEYWFYEMKLIKEYKRLEEYATLPSTQIHAGVNPIANTLAQNTRQPPKDRNLRTQKVCKKWNFADPNVKLKITTWMLDNKDILSDKEKLACQWLKEAMEGKDWKDVARNPEYKHYGNNYKEKYKERKGKGAREFNDRIRSQTTKLLKKIMEGTPVNMG